MRLKEKGLRVNIGKMKVMNCKVGVGQVENSVKYPCGICRKGVAENFTCCSSRKKWIHKRCSGVVDSPVHTLYIFPFTLKEASLAVSNILRSLNFTQEHLTLAIDDSSA